LLVIAVDWARVLYLTQCLTDCARSGALYASDHEARLQSPYASLGEAALAEAPGLSPTPTVSQVVATDANGNPTAVTVTVAMEFDTISNFPLTPKAQTISRSVTMAVAPMNPR
jgi:hypothetical protein